jgi:hypothetical protein
MFDRKGKYVCEKAAQIEICVGCVVYGVRRVGRLFHLDVIAGEYARSGADDARPFEKISNSSRA